MSIPTKRTIKIHKGSRKILRHVAEDSSSLDGYEFYFGLVPEGDFNDSPSLATRVVEKTTNSTFFSGVTVGGITQEDDRAEVELTSDDTKNLNVGSYIYQLMARDTDGNKGVIAENRVDLRPSIYIIS